MISAGAARPVNRYQKNQGISPAAAVSAAPAARTTDSPTRGTSLLPRPSGQRGAAPPTIAGTAARPANPPSSPMIAASVPSPNATSSQYAPSRLIGGCREVGGGGWAGTPPRGSNARFGAGPPAPAPGRPRAVWPGRSDAGGPPCA